MIDGFRELYGVSNQDFNNKVHENGGRRRMRVFTEIAEIANYKVDLR